MELESSGIPIENNYSQETKAECDQLQKFSSKETTNKNKNRRKSALPLKASQLQESLSLGEESQTSQSSLELDSQTSADNSEENNEFDSDFQISNPDTDVLELNLKSDTIDNEFKSKSDIKCNMCEKLFQYKSEFDSHYQNTYNRTPVYTCLFCNKTMDKYSTFRSHCYRHITKGRFKCEECGQGFKLQSHLQVHILSKHSKVKPFNCEECGKNFATKSGLKIHMKRHQVEAKEQYTCAECGKILHTRGGLTSHMNVHRLGRRFMCDVCGKTFTQKVNMQQHVKQHTGDKPYECDKCGKTFAEKSHLSRHNSFHTDDRPFKCEVCGKMYKTERCLKVHRLVHGKERPYVCTYCNKGFLSSTKLKQHYNIHTGERPFACKYCERKFTNYPNWLKHTRRKHNVDHKTGKDLITKHNLTSETESQSHNILNPNPKPDVYPKHSKTNDKMKTVKLEVKSETNERVSRDSELDLYEEDYDDYDDTLPLPPNLDFLPHLETFDHEPIHHDNLTTDFKLSKNDELYLQKRILNFPMTDNENTHEQDVHGFQSSSHFDLVPFI